MNRIPSGFRADSERIPNAYIRHATLRHSTPLHFTLFGLASKSKSSSSVTREPATIGLANAI